MKQILFALILFSLPSSLFSQEEIKEEKKWEMKNYFFVLLTTGPDRTQDSVTAAQIQKEHLANIGKLAEEGKIHIAGPFLDGGEWRGIFIFDADSEEEVIELLQTDAAIKSGRLSYTVKKWMTAKGSCLN